jgi:transcriptional regulator with XRE-family HTH domain
MEIFHRKSRPGKKSPYARMPQGLSDAMAASASQIGAWLRRARHEKTDLSIEDVARLIDVTERTLRAWEKGENAPPTDKFLELVLLYKADVLELLATRVTKGGSAAGESERERKRRLG